jgi:eukaryotic-like serine/threonine-protein kinase
MSKAKNPRPLESESTAARQSRLQAAANEYMQSAALGDPPGIEEFVRRYPDLADELRELLANATSLDVMPTPSRPMPAVPRSEPSAPFRLTAVEGVVSGRSATFGKCGSFLLGRSSRAWFLFPSGPGGDLRISHAHCLIELDPPLCRVHDLNSRNGTFVNGARITSSFLRDGDELRIGRSILCVQMPAAANVPSLEGDSSIEPALPLARAGPGRSAVNRSDCPICLQSKRKPDEPLCAKCQTRAALVQQAAPGYRFVREVGRGDLGATYLALDERTNRAVALKVIDSATAPDPGQRARLLREVEHLKRLRHRYIVPFHDFQSVGKHCFVASEFIRGTDTARLLRKHGALPVHIAVGIVCQLLSGLKFAHEFGLVHRDLKPANVLIRIQPDRRTVKIADYGLARTYWKVRVGDRPLPCDIGVTTAFLAPEQVLDYHGATPAADQYAAAAMLYHLLTNAFVYEQPKGTTAQFAQILDEDIVPIRDRRCELPPKLISAIHRALSREPERRFPDVAAFKKALLPFGGVK